MDVLCSDSTVNVVQPRRHSGGAKPIVGQRRMMSFTETPALFEECLDPQVLAPCSHDTDVCTHKS